MPNRETISRIAKILARAGSDNPGEASQALQGAYKRMARDGVSLHDLLSLPIEELYQDTLVKLVDVILSDQTDLSPSGKREAYSVYIQLIAARFSGAEEGQPSTGGDAAEAGGQGSSRAEEARAYEERRAREEAARQRENTARTKSAEKPFSQENTKTPEPQSAPAPSFTIGKFVFSFSPATFFQSLSVFFGRNSISWYSLREPGRALRLFAASLLFGCGFSAIVLLLAGTAHALTGTGPVWDVRLKNAFSFLAAVGFIWKARALFLSGWFR